MRGGGRFYESRFWLWGAVVAIGKIGAVLTVGLIALLTLATLRALSRSGALSGGLTTTGDGKSSPSRLQAVVSTVGFCVLYLLAVIRQGWTGSWGFPGVSDTALLLLGGSGAVYLGGKTGAGSPGESLNILFGLLRRGR